MHIFIQNELEVTNRAGQRTAGPTIPMNSIDPTNIKTCVRCGLDKPLSDFLRRSGRGGGAGARRGTCRSCRIVRQAMRETAAAVEHLAIVPVAAVSPAAPLPRPEGVPADGSAPASDGQAPKPAKRKRKRRSGKRGTAARGAAAALAAVPAPAEAVAPVCEAESAAQPEAPAQQQPAETPGKRKRKRSRRRKAAAAAIRQPDRTVDPAQEADPTAVAPEAAVQPDDDASTASAAQHGSVMPEDGPEAASLAEPKPGKRKRSRRRKSKAAAKAAALTAMAAEAAPAAERLAAAAPFAAAAHAAPAASAAVPPQPAAAAEAAEGPPNESKNARRRRLKMLANGYGAPIFILPANFLPLPPEQFEDDKPKTALQAAIGQAAGAACEAAPRPKRKRKRSRRRKGAPAAEALADAPPRVLMRRPPPEPPPGSVAQDDSVLRPTRQGIIRMRGRTDKGRRWQQETDLETAQTLVREHAAVVVNPFTIRRLFTSRAFRMYILDRDQYTCYFCGQYGDTIDHLRPRAKGGHTTPINCVCACSLCNQSKADRDLDEFVGEVGE